MIERLKVLRKLSGIRTSCARQLEFGGSGERKREVCCLISQRRAGWRLLFLYITLRQQDYALLTGAIALFIVLAIVMYVTRKVDWYARDSS